MLEHLFLQPSCLVPAWRRAGRATSSAMIPKEKEGHPVPLDDMQGRKAGQGLHQTHLLLLFIPPATSRNMYINRRLGYMLDPYN